MGHFQYRYSNNNELLSTTDEKPTPKGRILMTDQPGKFNLTSHNIAEDKQQEILRLFPEAQTEVGKIDFKRLKLALGETVDDGKERYGMNWPGKAECFKTIQQPSMATLRPVPEESVNFDTTKNLIIEGDNLEALKLLQKSYLGKIKMIYIDPPYNTGNDFIYPDNYTESLQTYLEYTGQVDTEGKKFGNNTDSEGRFHSKWMNMMYPRLYLARNLLRDDGAIFISIDEMESSNLRKLCDEIFGEDNFRNVFFARRYDKNINRQFMDQGLVSFNVGVEYIYCYAKTEQFKFNPVYRETSEERENFGYWKGFWNDANRPTMRFDILGFTPNTGQWKWSKARAIKALQNYQEYSNLYSNTETLEEYWRRTGKNLEFIRRNINGKGQNQGVEHWIPPSSGILRNTLLSDILASRASDEVNGLFDFPKNPDLINCLVQASDDENGLFLDFFAGSGTLAHTVMHLNNNKSGNRRFILVQLPEPTGREDYPTITEICKERVRRVIKKLNDQDNSKLGFNGGEEQDRGFRVFKLADSNFKTWNAQGAQDTASLEKQLELHIDHIKDNRSTDDLLYELLLKSGFPLTTHAETLTLAGKTVHSIAAGMMFICLEKEITMELIRAMADKNPERVVCLDAGFAENDQLKANAVQIFKAKEIKKFETV